MKRILLVAHGANHSTYDLYAYYQQAMQNNGDIVLHSFPYHSVMEYHHAALMHTKRATEDTVVMKAIYAASRDIVTDIALFEPDHVLFVGGLAVPDKISTVVYNFRNQLKNEYMIGYIFTESPYEDQDQEHKQFVADYVFYNDLNSARKYNPDGDLLISYLPHAYNPSVHYAYRKVDNYQYDVVFCGTLYPNRVDFFNSLDLHKTNSIVIGAYADYIDGDKLRTVNHKEGHLDNINLANLYRESKIAINFHREDSAALAYSMNPRLRESVMCGSLPVSDFRQEIVDVFGDAVPVFDSPEQANSIILELLADEEQRMNRVMEAQKRVASHTYSNNLTNIILPLLEEGETAYGKDRRA